MKFVRHMISLSLLMLWGEVIHAQPMDSKTLDRYIHDFSQVGTVEETSFDISGFTNKLNQKESSGASTKFCRLLFNKTRQEFFRRYTQYATFSETLNKGRYNCLTGTALYALLF